jgi:hypothetical protein
LSLIKIGKAEVEASGSKTNKEYQTSNLATHQKVIKNKLGVLKLAETLENVS